MIHFFEEYVNEESHTELLQSNPISPLFLILSPQTPDPDTAFVSGSELFIGI